MNNKILVFITTVYWMKDKEADGEEFIAIKSEWASLRHEIKNEIQRKLSNLTLYII